MKESTLYKRIESAIKKYIPNESDSVKDYIFDILKDTYLSLCEEGELRGDGKPYTDSQNLRFAISITLDDLDTPMILKEARRLVENEY